MSRSQSSARSAPDWRPPVPRSASAADQIWNCRASAAYIAIPAQDRTEPVLANGSARTATESPDRARCADDDAKPVGPGTELGLTGPVAQTSVSVRCGKGKDVVRFNTNERRRVKGCERRYSIR